MVRARIAGSRKDVEETRRHRNVGEHAMAVYSDVLGDGVVVRVLEVDGYDEMLKWTSRSEDSRTDDFD